MTDSFTPARRGDVVVSRVGRSSFSLAGGVSNASEWRVGIVTNIDRSGRVTGIQRVGPGAPVRSGRYGFGDQQLVVPQARGNTDRVIRAVSRANPYGYFDDLGEVRSILKRSMLGS